MLRHERLELDGAGADPVLFYNQNDKWGVFSNFSRHPIVLPHPFTGELTIYRTSEHRYQAMKSWDPEDHDWVVDAQSPAGAKSRGAVVQLRDDWGSDKLSVCYFVMVDAVMAKAIQVPAMTDALLGTGNRHIYEDSPVDDIWGWRYGEVYRGKNLLGEALMHVRAVLTAG